MVGKGNEKAPAAVAGVQIDYDIFRELFFNETNKVRKIFFTIYIVMFKANPLISDATILL